mgnify:FL=1
MSEFKGYLIKFPKNGLQFPHKLIAKESYQATPLQRTEIKAYRDSNNLLRRVTSPNNKTKITFNTIDGLTLAQMQSIRNILNGAMSNSQQRKLNVEYWDDELLAYRTMTAYMPDITYTPKIITADNIKYSAVTFTFIEY